MPLAPGLFSTITVWPSAALSLAATMRAIWSMVGPGGTGTTMLIGLPAGQSCAEAGRSAAKRQSAATTAVIVGLAFMTLLPPRLRLLLGGSMIHRRVQRKPRRQARC